MSKLKSRLFAGFFSCAFLAAISGTLGVLCMRHVQGKLQMTTREISATIDRQNRGSVFLSSLRATCDAIVGARSRDSLESLQSELANRSPRGASEGESELLRGVLAEIGSLIAHRSREMAASERMTDLSKSCSGLLKIIDKTTVEMVDASDFSATLFVEDAIDGIRTNATSYRQEVADKFREVFATSERSIGSIRAALSMRSSLHELNALAKDALLSQDTAVVDYAEGEIATLLANATKALARLKEDKAMAQVFDGLKRLAPLIRDILEVKRQILAGEVEHAVGLASLSRQKKTLDEAVAAINKAAVEKSDAAEFSASMDIENALGRIQAKAGSIASGTQTDVANVSKTTTRAITTIKTALSVRSYCHELDALVKDSLLATDTALIEYSRSDIKTLLRSARDGITLLSQDETTTSVSTALTQLTGLVDHMLDAKSEMLESQSDLTRTREQLASNMSRLDDELAAEAEALRAKADATFLRSSTIVSRWQLVQLFIGCGAVVLAVVIGVLVSRSIGNPISNVIRVLNRGAVRVTTTSRQVEDTSKQIAAGAGDQASSLDQVSSSLEQMAAMTRQTAASAEDANSMAADTRLAAEKGFGAMGELTEAIARIRESSNQTAEIVKMIDEIASQTNLLALNAAVEAARAGEAGRGFAVVAQEVRSLAKRSAEAAKESGELISQSREKAETGVGTSEQVVGIFQRIVQDIQKGSDRIAEVSGASQEQALGIEQVSDAVTQMDKVTQSNVSYAKRSAVASMDLSRQSEELGEIVQVLVGIVGGLEPVQAQAGAFESDDEILRPGAKRGPAADRSAAENLPPVHAVDPPTRADTVRPPLLG